MIELTNSAHQIVHPGGALFFDKVVLHTGCAERYDGNSSGSIKLKATGIYEVHFSANVSSNFNGGKVQLALKLGNDILSETLMTATSSNAYDISNVSTATLVRNCGENGDSIMILNTGCTDAFIDSNPTIFVKRVS